MLGACWDVHLPGGAVRARSASREDAVDGTQDAETKAGCGSVSSEGGGRQSSEPAGAAANDAAADAAACEPDGSPAAAAGHTSLAADTGPAESASGGGTCGSAFAAKWLTGRKRRATGSAHAAMSTGTGDTHGGGAPSRRRKRLRRTQGQA